MSTLRRRASLLVSLVAIFAALHTILGLVPGIWRRWIIAIEPLEGVILGPIGGFLSALIGSLISNFIRPTLYFFRLGEPIGALTAGLAYKRKYRVVFAIYTVMLATYFIHPLGRELPAWCLWDIYMAYIFSIAAPSILKFFKKREEEMKLFLATLLGLEADVLTRIFFLIPVELYKVLGASKEALVGWWIAGAFETPIETIIGLIVTLAIGIPLLKALDKSHLIEYPVT
ncbi:MAG: hypothetical protein DRJ37_03315 [Thermoprotei archaeon]|nr:MAG: hypothetical protein DRJ37_03315 [Thermoprotei archaeon]